MEPFVAVLRPIITKIEDYHQKHGAYPASLANIQVLEYLKQTNWTAYIRYYRNETDGYSVGAKLNFDVILWYLHTSSKQEWVIDTGIPPVQTIELSLAPEQSS